MIYSSGLHLKCVQYITRHTLQKLLCGDNMNIAQHRFFLTNELLR